MAKRTQVVRLTRAEILEQRDMQVRGECLSSAAQLTGSRNIDDIIRSADRIFGYLKDGKVPAEPNIESLSSQGRAEFDRTDVRPKTKGL